MEENKSMAAIGGEELARIEALTAEIAKVEQEMLKAKAEGISKLREAHLGYALRRQELANELAAAEVEEERVKALAAGKILDRVLAGDLDAAQPDDSDKAALMSVAGRRACIAAQLAALQQMAEGEARAIKDRHKQAARRLEARRKELSEERRKAGSLRRERKLARRELHDIYGYCRTIGLSELTWEINGGQAYARVQFSDAPWPQPEEEAQP